MRLSVRLRKARINKKLSQSELAKRVNTTTGTISNYENEHSTPNHEMLAKIADVLEVSVDWLLARTDGDKEVGAGSTDPISQEIMQELDLLPDDTKKEILRFIRFHKNQS